MEEPEDLFAISKENKSWLPLGKCFGYVLACSVLFGSGIFVHGRARSQFLQNDPFLRVTNRAISLFLWQNPSLMRAWAKNKQSYLPAFEAGETIGLNPEYADEYALAPPEVLFLYHAWHRLIGLEYPKRIIPGREFATFLQDVPEWQPRNWKSAPITYMAFTGALEDTRTYSANDLPWEVYRAFIGWKNYFIEGAAINALNTTKKEVEAFLNHYPHYGSGYWQNIVGPSYLESLHTLTPEELVPAHEIPPFLRVALYNFIKVDTKNLPL